MPDNNTHAELGPKDPFIRAFTIALLVKLQFYETKAEQELFSKNWSMARTTSSFTNLGFFETEKEAQDYFNSDDIEDLLSSDEWKSFLPDWNDLLDKKDVSPRSKLERSNASERTSNNTRTKLIRSKASVAPIPHVQKLKPLYLPGINELNKALLFAMCYSSAEYIKSLINAGAIPSDIHFTTLQLEKETDKTINEKSMMGGNTLHLISSSTTPKTIRLLTSKLVLARIEREAKGVVANMAPTHAYLTCEDLFGKTPFHIAAEVENWAVFYELTKALATSQGKESYHESALEITKELGLERHLPKIEKFIKYNSPETSWVSKATASTSAICSRFLTPKGYSPTEATAPSCNIL